MIGNTQRDSRIAVLLGVFWIQSHISKIDIIWLQNSLRKVAAVFQLGVFTVKRLRRLTENNAVRPEVRFLISLFNLNLGAGKTRLRFLESGRTWLKF